MILPDVNVLVYAHREDARDHRAYRDWLEATANADAAFGLSDLVISGFVRIVTHPRIFAAPSSLADAMQFAEDLLSALVVLVDPARRRNAHAG